MAENDHVAGRLLQALKLLGNLSHGDQHGAFNMADLMFFGFPNVNEQDFLGRIQTLLYLCRCNFKW